MEVVLEEANQGKSEDIVHAGTDGCPYGTEAVLKKAVCTGKKGGVGGTLRWTCCFYFFDRWREEDDMRQMNEYETRMTELNGGSV